MTKRPRLMALLFTLPALAIALLLAFSPLRTALWALLKVMVTP